VSVVSVNESGVCCGVDISPNTAKLVVSTSGLTVGSVPKMVLLESTSSCSSSGASVNLNTPCLGGVLFFLQYADGSLKISTAFGWFRVGFVFFSLIAQRGCLAASLVLRLR
jgi:hypothetical protein